jgi:replicative superfamily II helicase
MVDYAKLHRRKKTQTLIDPIEIFRRLPKDEKFKDLFDIQRKALLEWLEQRNNKDIVIKLNTGGGKTLVGLLIAQSIMNEHRGGVLYLCPNWQLVRQVIEKAQEVGIKAHQYERRVDAPEFLNGQSILVAPYQALFNGLSKFGLKGQSGVTTVQGIILDDAHASLPIMRQQFTLPIDADERRELYEELVGLFRHDFKMIRKAGILDDILQGQERSVLEVPYWSWSSKTDAVRQMLTNAAKQEEWDNYTFAWPLLRDELDVCHALISARDFSITPIHPIVDLFPTFVDCPRRAYMSATLPDDSAIIRTFNASPENVANPIMPVEMINVGERMLLSPALTGINTDDQINVVKKLALYISKEIYHGEGAGVVILVPSYTAAQEWTDIGTLSDSRESAEQYVTELQNGTSKGPFIFANRYDGMDLPGNSCRLLILAGLPKGIDAYDIYLGGILGESSTIRTTIAQRIEQGAGRSTRGSGDFSVILFVGNDLTAWVGTSANRKFFNQVTRTQFEIGVEVSKAITGFKELIRTVNQCVDQHIDWRTFHAEAIADLSEPLEIDEAALKVAAAERRFFRLLRHRQFGKAVLEIEEVVNGNVIQDRKYIGWLLQLGARAAYLGDNKSKVQELQERASKANSVLLMPERISYIPLSPPDKQAEAIVRQVSKFSPPTSYLARFEEIASYLNATVSSNQFEEALKNFGIMLGFQAHRPENNFGRGPDVLWLLDDHTGFVIEAKSKKATHTPLNKKEYGQLLVSYEWFKSVYEGYEGIKVVVHPNVLKANDVISSDTRVLTLNNLAILISRTRELLLEVCHLDIYAVDKLQAKCEDKLDELGLKPPSIQAEFLQPFSNRESELTSA